MKTTEQQARDLLERIGVEDAQRFSAGDLVELANLIERVEAAETALALWEHAYESGCVDADLAAAYKATP